MRILKWQIFSCVIVVGLGLWALNTSMFVDVPFDQNPRLLAHRGVHQIYAGTTRNSDTCTANPVTPMTHDYIANTIRSIKAAFAYGADVVELDVHLTADGEFAVFHDWTLECQTNGFGVTHKQTIPELKALDVGHGYSVDGVTFPLRGTGVGLMPTLREVFEANLGGRYLVNFKSNRGKDGDRLASILAQSGVRDQVFAVYGGQRPTRAAIGAVAGLDGFDRAALKTCLMSYALMGWSGGVPDSCANRIIAVPLDYAPYMWGWPHRFTERMKAVGTSVILWGPYDGSGFSSGIDDVETLGKVPAQFDGYIWTNRIEVIGPMVRR